MSDFGVKTVSILNPINLSVGTMNGVAIVAGGSTYSSGSLGLVAGANITLSTGASNVTIIGGAGAGGGAALQGSGTYTQNSGTIQFSNSNNFTFGLTANQMTASFSDPNIQYTSNTSNITTGAFPNANTTKFAGSGFTGTNATGTLNSNGLAISVGAGGGNTVTASGSNGSFASNGLSFVGSNGINVYTTNGSSIIISGPTVGGAQTGISTVAGGGTTFTSGGVTILGSGNVSITNNAGSLVISGSTQSVQTQSTVAVNGSTGNISLTYGSNLTSSSNGSTITFGIVTNYSTNWSNALTTAAQSNQVVNSLFGSTGVISLVTGSSLSSSQNGSTVTFGLASNISTAWSGQTTANSSQVVAVNGSSGQISFATGSNITSSSNGSTITWGLVTNYSTNWTNITSNAFNTSGSSNFVLTANSTKFVSVGSISTTSTAGSLMTGSANSAGITLALPAWITTAAAGGGVAISGGGSLFTSGTVSFGNTNGFSFITTNGSIGLSAQYDNDTVYLGGNTSNASSVNITNGAFYFAGGNNITLSASGSTVTIVGATAAGAGAAVSIGGNSTSAGAGYSNITAGTAVLMGGNNITLSQNGASISIVGGAGGGGFYGSLLGNNTAGNTTVTGASIGISGLNLTLSGTNNSQYVISAPATSSLVGVNGITVSSAGSTISVSGLIPTYSSTNNMEKGFTAINTYGQGSLSLQRIVIPFNVTASALAIGGSMSVATNTSATSASVNFSINCGIYTLNGSTLSLASSGSTNNAVSWSSNTTGSVTGMKIITAPINVSMTPGVYWLGVVMSTGTTYTGHTLSLYGANMYGTAGVFSPFGVSTASTMVDPFAGIYTAATSACPSSISNGQINYSSASNVQRANIYFNLYNNTY